MTNELYRAIFRVASALEIPVVIAALLALVAVLLECGRFAAELHGRRGSAGSGRAARLSAAARAARDALDADDVPAAGRALAPVLSGPAMRAAAAQIVDQVQSSDGHPDAVENTVAKELADFDFGRLRRLERTRLLVRAGPALGLMGTLIPLTPALDGLARGDVGALTDNLRLAFSVTVLGLLVGAVAFGLSLARDRYYGQQYSDLEFIASVLVQPSRPASPTDRPA